MGEIDDDDCDETDAQYREQLDRAETYRWDGIAAKLRAAGPPPRTLAKTPVILETPFASDPGHLLALLCAAASDDLALVVTNDADDHATRYARYVLDLAGRDDVPVVAQAQRRKLHRAFDNDGRPAPPIEGPSADVLAAVRKMCASTSAAVRWIGTGCPTTLAHVLNEDMQVRERLAVTQSDNGFARDPVGAAKVIETVEDLLLVRSETVTDATITVHQKLWAAACCAPVASELEAYLDRWPANPVCSALPVATTAAGLLMPSAEFTRRQVVVNDSGQINIDPANGHRRWITMQVNDVDLWLGKQLARLPIPRERSRP
ncbi:hypothetical protein IU450_33995 [Nocardia abscessus]|uniref:hypothetical protein n=1 Tax=Nocardia abscessus TaxID=120957 RepID=UPI0018930B6F|nr:hypothetical protein [Nocardia abscessus]MBF6340867.1 hypothetical protein [Nocardia abscessus]